MKLDELKKLALAATPGPWQTLHKGTHVFVGNWDIEQKEITCGVTACETDDQDKNYEANANFIAAANPKTILAMIEEIDAARKIRDAIIDVAPEHPDEATDRTPYQTQVIDARFDYRLFENYDALRKRNEGL